ncbi:hypothetical protein ACHAXA_007762 [Cyclostephanos tholiformis]|uniref:DUF6824 domain-containing protein n=1 Tax=Cyclostephanos tholiformis TaxID=382380 RepID=A0ABD3RDX9_9STRA
MNPLLSFWIKVQPLSGGLLGNHTWKAISQSSALARAEDWDDAVVVDVAKKRRTPPPMSLSTSSSSFAYYDSLRTVASRLASTLRAVTTSWLLNPAIVMRMQRDYAPITRPSRHAICEADRPAKFARETSKVGGGGGGGGGIAVDPKRFAAPHVGTLTPLQLSHEMLSRRDHSIDNNNDSGASLLRPLVRRNSGEWVREYRKEARIDKINYNNIFGGTSDPSNNDIPTLPPIPTTAVDYAGHFVPDSPVSSSRSSSSSVASADTVSSMPSLSSIPSSSPESRPSSSISPDLPRSSSSSSSSMAIHRGAAPPGPNDVICGRGGKANTHAGNVNFREEARKLRGWYESSSKSEKFTISSFLVDIVRERGGRFLKRDGTVKGGGWLEADGDDVRKKASQALREGRCR